MSNREQHCRETMEKLGKRFEEVHKYLDKYFRMFGPAHRYLLHHIEGIEEVRQYFGSEAAEAARLHILIDCEGYIPKKSDYYDGTVDACGVLTKKDET